MRWETDADWQNSAVKIHVRMFQYDKQMDRVFPWEVPLYPAKVSDGGFGQMAQSNK